ncbi:MAG: ABC transporter permease [Chloroflexi bacterium]|nr:ABC transporter permease [Chloroflexota bacterium]
MLFSLVLKNLWARPLRSVLTILGIGISIAVIIALFALATNVKDKLGSATQITQADLVVTRRGLAGPTGGSIPESCIKDVAECEGVRRTAGFLLATVSLSEMSSFNLFGVVPEDKELYLGEQQISEGDYIESGGEVALGSRVKSTAW